VYLGHEPNLAEFLNDVFQHVKDKKFRSDFLEVLGDLTHELRGLSRRRIKESKEYVSELLFLCGAIKQFEEKDTLMEIAVSGDFKGVTIGNSDLHAKLLTTLASYRIAGTCEFWIDQFLDDSNKRYANPAFYALKDYPDMLFQHIGIFIDKFQGEVELVLGVMSLVDEIGLNKTVKRFKLIESQLSPDQKEAVNNVFEELKYGKPFRIPPEPAKQAVYKPLKTAVSMAGEKPSEYTAGETLREKAGEIFKGMGFEVHFDYQLAGHAVDIFIKRKKLFSNVFECWVCRCREGKRKVGKHEVERYLPVRDAAEGCDVVIISETGFTKGAVQLASVHGILLKIMEDLNNE
jgi:hypothetical protein